MSAKGRSEAFPQGSMWRCASRTWFVPRERPPPRGGVSGGPKGGPLTPPRWRTSAEKGGVAPSIIPASRTARRRAVRGRDTRGPRPTALYRSGLGESVPTHVQCGFPVKDPATAARAAPSDSAVLWLPNACTTWMRHPTLVRWPPIRRHGLDPRRQKSSIDSQPLGAGLSCSLWRIFPTTASRPPWRSTAVPVGRAPQHPLFALPAP